MNKNGKGKTRERILKKKLSWFWVRKGLWGSGARNNAQNCKIFNDEMFNGSFYSSTIVHFIHTFIFTRELSIKLIAKIPIVCEIEWEIFFSSSATIEHFNLSWVVILNSIFFVCAHREIYFDIFYIKVNEEEKVAASREIRSFYWRTSGDWRVNVLINEHCLLFNHLFPR